MKNLTVLMQAQFDKMCKTGKLFKSTITGKEIWNLYLNGFGDDAKFRDPESSEHNCNLCNNFIRRYGNIISIDGNYNISTIFDVEAPSEYKESINLISKTLKASYIQDIFTETFNSLNSMNYEKCDKNNSKYKLGIAKNVKRYTKEEAEKFGVVKPNEIKTFNHFNLNIPNVFVDQSGDSIESIMANYRDAKNVFKKAMDEISLDTFNLVKDLINQGSLLDGETHLYKIDQILPLKKEYNKLSSAVRDTWCWIKSYNLPFAKFKNELIGVLCSELAEGKEINKACQSWNKRVDPANYMKAVAPITKSQIESAKKFVEENNYSDSFDRRVATIDDIKASEILHMNGGDEEVKSVSIFDDVKSTSTKHKRNKFKSIEEVSIEKFMKDILPTCISIEAFLSNAHESNLATLTTANIKDSNPIFKWTNNYSWTFNGNLAGKSQIKETVKGAGGKIDGDLRFSIMWAEGNDDNSDLDAHCIEPDGHRIYYSNKHSYKTDGKLDIDITNPKHQMSKGAVENIVYPTLNQMNKGVYSFSVNQFSANNSKGFKAEIEFNGQIYSYEYNKPVKDTVEVAKVMFNSEGLSIIHKLPETNSSKELYNLNTEEFHKVNLVCLSPNHWNENKVGNKHYFFMLDKCKAPTAIRSFHAENLLPELAKHRKVFEVLGNTSMIQPSEKAELSGLGFNATVKDSVILKIQGSFKRMIKIIF